MVSALLHLSLPWSVRKAAHTLGETPPRPLPLPTHLTLVEIVQRNMDTRTARSSGLQKLQARGRPQCHGLARTGQVHLPSPSWEEIPGPRTRRLQFHGCLLVSHLPVCAVMLRCLAVCSHEQDVFLCGCLVPFVRCPSRCRVGAAYNEASEDMQCAVVCVPCCKHGPLACCSLVLPENL